MEGTVEVYSLAHPFRFAELSLPFVGELYNGIAPKTFITIRGTVKRSQSQESFRILLRGASTDIPLEIQCHPRDTLIRVGHKVNGVFQQNFETDNCAGIFSETGFNLTIYVTPLWFLIELNGRVLTTLHHQLPLSTIRFLEITGVVNIIAISSADIKERNLPNTLSPSPPPSSLAGRQESVGKLVIFGDLLSGIAEALVDLDCGGSD